MVPRNLSYYVVIPCGSPSEKLAEVKLFLRENCQFDYTYDISLDLKYIIVVLESEQEAILVKLAYEGI